MEPGSTKVSADQNDKAWEFLRLVANTDWLSPVKKLENYTLTSIHQYLLSGSPSRLVPCWNTTQLKNDYEAALKSYSATDFKVIDQVKVCRATREAKQKIIDICLDEQKKIFDEAEAKFKLAEERTMEELKAYKEECAKKLAVHLAGLRQKYKRLEIEILKEKMKQYVDEDKEWNDLVESKKNWMSIEEFALAQNSTTDPINETTSSPILETTTSPIIETTTSPIIETTPQEELNSVVQPITAEDRMKVDSPIPDVVPEIQTTRNILVKNKATGDTYTTVHINQSEVDIKLARFREIANGLPTNARFLLKSAPITPAQEGRVNLKQIIGGDDVVWVSIN